MDENDTPPLSDRSLWQAIADVDRKLDRLAGLGAQSVTQVDRLARLVAANNALDARAANELRGVLTEARAVLSQIRDAAPSFSEEPGASAIVRRRRGDDTVSLVLHVGQTRIKLSKKRIAMLFTLIGTAVGAAAHWLAVLASR